MNKELNELKLTLMKIINNPKTSEASRELAREALDAVRETQQDYNDPRTKEEATTRLVNVFGSVPVTNTTQEEV